MVPYETAEEFFANEKPRRKIGGREFYSSYQIAQAIGCAQRTVQRYIHNGTLQEKFGIKEIFRDPINGRFLFCSEDVEKMYQKYISPVLETTLRL